MKTGDFVNIDYVGRIKSSGEVFDYTLPDIAKKMGRQGEFAPITVILGAGHLIPGLDDEVRKHKVGDEFEIDILPERAFGRRNPKLMQLIQKNKFKREKVEPMLGMRVSVNNMLGTIRSVSSGRIIVDFNHPLAGKELHYWVRINKLVKSRNERVKSLLEYYGLKDFTFKLVKNSLTINLPALSDARKAFLTKQLQTHIKVKSVKFEEKNQTKSK